MAAYDDAVAELYQAPHPEFVAERKRLAAQLKGAGDKEAAARLSKLPRPTISAWVVNQLWWHARDAFDALFDTAAKLRKGKLDATPAHREAIATLRARASRMLTGAGHGATEATLRRVQQTLSALAANGWEPDVPGALAVDRDPPGFEALGIPSVVPDEDEPVAMEPPKQTDGHATKAAAAAKAKHDEEARQRAEAEAAAERRRIEQERARRKAERHRLEAALRTAKGEIIVQEREVEKAKQALADAEDSLAQAHAVVEDLAAKVEQLAD